MLYNKYEKQIIVKIKIIITKENNMIKNLVTQKINILIIILIIIIKRSNKYSLINISYLYLHATVS